MTITETIHGYYRVKDGGVWHITPSALGTCTIRNVHTRQQDALTDTQVRAFLRITHAERIHDITDMRKDNRA